MVLGIEQATMKADGTQDLLRGLLQVIRCQDVGWIGKETGRRVEIEVRRVEQLAIGSFLRRASPSIDDVTLPRDRFGELTGCVSILLEVAAADRDRGPRTSRRRGGARQARRHPAKQAALNLRILTPVGVFRPPA